MWKGDTMKICEVCQEQDMFNEISSLRRDFQLNGYPQGFVDGAINSKCSSRPNEEEKPSASYGTQIQ
jgi:hypothetical protein